MTDKRITITVHKTDGTSFSKTVWSSGSIIGVMDAMAAKVRARADWKSYGIKVR